MSDLGGSLSGMGAIGALLFLAVMALIYFAPAITAKFRKHHNVTSIFVLNLLLGWTGIGWIASLVWALTKTDTQVEAPVAPTVTLPAVTSVGASASNVHAHFAPPANVERTKPFFANLGDDRALRARLKNQDTGEVEGWSVVAEWDASHKVPKRGDGQAVNPPQILAWSPKGDRIFTSCDYYEMASWRPDGRLEGQDCEPSVYGWARRMLVRRTGDSYSRNHRPHDPDIGRFMIPMRVQLRVSLEAISGALMV